MVGGLDAQHLHPWALGRDEGEPDDVVAADRIPRGLVQAGVRPEPGLHRHGVEAVPDGAAVLKAEIKADLRKEHAKLYNHYQCTRRVLLRNCENRWIVCCSSCAPCCYYRWLPLPSSLKPSLTS